MKKNYSELSVEMHKEKKGKLEVISKVKVTDKDALSIAYTPGVAEPCRLIAKNKEDVYTYTIKGNTIAIVTDGTAVLGLGDIGPEAGLPVMEGKALLFKEFGGIDAFPIAIDSKNVEDIIKTVKLISPGFGGINLEDISAPRCFEIEKRLSEELSIPIFHDDQHGTAIVVLAGLINSLKLAGKSFDSIKVVLSGAGAAGIAITKLLLSQGVKKIIMVDREGAIYSGREKNMNSMKDDVAKITNLEKEKGSIANILKGADVFIGVSAPDLVTKEMVESMNKNPIIFAMANPTPEIMPEEAHAAGAFIVATGRSDYPNQINNVLAFPGVFKGTLAVRASDINEEMKIAAAHAIADAVKEISVDKIIPSPFEKGLADLVANAVKSAAIKSGINRI